MAVEVNKILLEVQIDSKGVVKNTDQINKKLKELGTSANVAQKGFTDMNSAAGIAGSTVTEFGRLVSDLPYGIQGVANNLSQLGSMFSLLVVQAGKMNNEFSTSRNVFNLIKDQVVGPVGILVAFQALIAGIEYFTRRTKEANEELKEFNDQIIFQGRAASDFLSILEDENVENEKKVQIVRGLVSANKDLAAAIDAGGDPLQVTTNHLRNLSEEVKLRERLLSLEEKFSNEYNNILPTRELYLKNEQRINEITTGQAQITGRAAAVTLDGLQKQNKAIKEIIDLRVEEAAIIQRRNELFEESLDVERGDIDQFYDFGKDAAFEFNKGFEEILLTQDDKLRGFTKLTEKFEAEPYFPYVNLLKLEGELAIEQERENARRLYEEKKKSLAKNAELIDTVVKGLGAFNDILNAQADRELAIEENKTTKLNDQLKRRLANEQLTAEQRDRINQQIAKNDTKLVEIQNEIARKQFQRDKAFKIAMAIGDTASSALKAYSSQLLPFDPTSIVRAKIAAGVATAFGLAQVAALTRLKYTEQGLPTPNLTSQNGGAGLGEGAPEFNVVGAAGQNQLAEAIASTQAQPVKAYVVSNDVTTAQQLDRNIIEGASI